MAIASKLMSIGIIAVSLAVGFLSFYLLSDHSKEIKKIHLEEITSQIINLLLFIWLGKIILKLRLFISDPLSVLAYPSDSKAFYFAIVLVGLLVLYKSKRKNMNVLPLLESFVCIFLIASFIYEFIQFVEGDNIYAFSYLILLSVLIGIFFFLKERISTTILMMTLITVWSLGIILLGFIQSFVTVFGYMMKPGFVGVFFVLSMSILIYKFRKRDA